MSEEYEEFLTSKHTLDIIKILLETEELKCYSLYLNFVELFESNANLGSALLNNPELSLNQWNEAALRVQHSLQTNEKCIIKCNVTCRVYGLPPWPHVSRLTFPVDNDAGKFLQITGTVVRMMGTKLLVYKKTYICVRCKHKTVIKADFEKGYIIKPPQSCANPNCSSKTLLASDGFESDNCKDYQEIKIEEDFSKLKAGTMPNTILVILEDDLVDSCKPGENISVCGVVKRRWGEFSKGCRIDVTLVLKANHIKVNNTSSASDCVISDEMQFVTEFWKENANKPVTGRDKLLKSFCPQLYGLYLVKLASMVVLAGGSHSPVEFAQTGVKTRSQSHILLVGDPGTGKSQILRFASKVMGRSVLTTGVGTTAAGLTTAAIMENGEWQLEAGALVMSDGGTCCIDEFNSMKEHDRLSIHEAMEQQTISVAKASIVCSLKTRCCVFAACNPKGNLDSTQPLCMNIAIASPLLSRFDLVLLIQDVIEEEKDCCLAEFILGNSAEHVDVCFTLEQLQMYYSVIKKINPIISTNAEKVLTTYYQIKRKSQSRDKSRTTVRLLESLARLAQGHARLMFHKEVTVMDCVFAIALIEATMGSDSLFFDNKNCTNKFPTNPEIYYSELVQIISNKLGLQSVFEENKCFEIDENVIDKEFPVAQSTQRVDHEVTNRNSLIVSKDDKLTINIMQISQSSNLLGKRRSETTDDNDQKKKMKETHFEQIGNTKDIPFGESQRLPIGDSDNDTNICENLQAIYATLCDEDDVFSINSNFTQAPLPTDCVEMKANKSSSLKAKIRQETCLEKQHEDYRKPESASTSCYARKSLKAVDLLKQFDYVPRSSHVNEKGDLQSNNTISADTGKDKQQEKVPLQEQSSSVDAYKSLKLNAYNDIDAIDLQF